MKKKTGGSFCISWGRYGGFYIYNNYTIRICLGWLAFTYFPDDIDEIFNLFSIKNKKWKIK